MKTVKRVVALRIAPFCFEKGDIEKMRHQMITSRFLLTLGALVGLMLSTWLPVAAAPARAALAAGVPNAQNTLISGSALLDDQFQTQNGQVTGDIQDALIDISTGQIWFVTLNYGGFLDIGDKTVAVPLNALRWNANGRFVLNFDEQQLRSFPDLGNDWPDFSNAHWMDQVKAFWHNLGFDDDTNGQAAQSNQVVRASDLTGFSIGDIGFGDGTTKNLIIDLGQGIVKYAVLSYSTGLFSNQLVAVPLRAFNATPSGKQLGFANGVDRSVLEAAPHLDRNLLTRTGPLDQTWADQNNTFWAQHGFAADSNQ